MFADVLSSRRPASRAVKAVLAASIAVPIACALVSGLGGAPGPMIPFFDPTGPVYLDLFTALASLSALLFLVPGAVAAYRCFGTWAAILLVAFLLGLTFLCVRHVTFS